MSLKIHRIHNFLFLLFAITSAFHLAIVSPAQSQASGIIITKHYDGGGVYVGEFLNGKQHGQGTYTLPSGYEYSGEWIEGRIEGNGVARFPNGSVYEGEFVNGAPEGQGKIVFADGGTYEGGWVGGVISGFGTAVYANGVVYTGGFANAVHHGAGTMTSPNGYVYTGDWIEGTKDGLGVVRYPDGVRYAGGISNGARSGRGLVIFPNGASQFGNWVEGQTTARTANAHSVLQTLRNAFERLSIEQRRFVQEALKSEGLYNSTVDGQWGRNTLWALAQYAIIEIHSIDLDDEQISSQLFILALEPH